MTDITLLAARIKEAESALHRLMTGAAVSVLERDGRRIEYAAATPGDADRLRTYIASLKAEIAFLESVGLTRRPVSFSF